MLNKVMIIGNLGKDPELRYTASGKAVASFSVAVTEKWGGEEKTEWFNIIVWEKTAEICGKFLSKGSKVYLEGRMQNRSWDDKEGNKKYITEIVCHQMQMLTPKKEGQGGQSQAPPARPAQKPVAPTEQPFDPNDDIPF